ncbi:hypothetical protein As57867_010429, partial [Aphanomyces stellatus]
MRVRGHQKDLNDVAAQPHDSRMPREHTLDLQMHESDPSCSLDSKDDLTRLARKISRRLTKQDMQLVADRMDICNTNIVDVKSFPARYHPIVHLLRSSPTHGDIFESLKRIFGFQTDNVKNQTEHLVLLLTNHKERLETPPPILRKADTRSARAPFEVPKDANEAATQAIMKLHARLFDNYIKWCAYLGVQPGFSKEPLVDVVLFFLMWGEAGNLRHMPELLCFLFHSLSPMAQPTASPKAPRAYLETVVRPIYDEMKMENDKKTPFGERAPHAEICNYDDWNEFFWTKACFQFDAYNIKDAYGVVDRHGTPTLVRKTFTETRSWFRALLSYRRIVWLNFALLCATVGYAVNMTLLCPDSSIMYGPEVGHEVHIFNKVYYNRAATFQARNPDAANTTGRCNIPKLATCLSVPRFELGVTFQFLPQDFSMLLVDVPFSTCLDLVTGRCSCYLETLENCFKQTGTGMALVNSTNRDIRDYVPVTFDQRTCMPQWKKAALHVIEDGGDGKLNCNVCSTAPMLPTLASQFLDLNRGDNGVILFCAGAGALALFFVVEIFNWLVSPITCGYLGRNMPVPVVAYCRYMSFWILLFLVKVVFDYTFMVKKLVETSFFIWSSDPSKYLPVSNFMFQVSYHNIIYIVFLWLPAFVVFMYNVQIFYALFSVILGSCLGFKLRIGELRSFHVLRHAFGDLPKMFNWKLIQNPIEDKLFQIDSRKETSKKGVKEAQHALLRIQTTPTSTRNETNDVWDLVHSQYNSVNGIGGDEFLRVVPFALAWNRCLQSMRVADILSNRELSLLSYMIEGDKTIGRRLFPPAFLTAGKLDKALDIIVECGATYDRLLLDDKRDAALAKIEECMRMRLQKDNLRVEACLGSYVFLVRVVQQLLGGAHADLSPCFAFVEECVINSHVLKGLTVTNLHALRTASVDLVKFLLDVPKDVDMNSVKFKRVLNGVIDRTVQFLCQLKHVLSKQASLAKIINETPLKPNSFFMTSDSSQRYATTQLSVLLLSSTFMAIVSRAYQVLTVDNFDAEPRSEEGRRRLRFFTNSLFMDMPSAQSIKRMHSLSISTPYYNEIVMYSVKELTQANDDSIKLLYYLQTIYHDEWEHFLERMKVKDEKEALAKVPQEVQLWASYRGQTLARTIRGMMYNEEAIKFLYWLELGNNEPMPDHSQELDEMVALKFNYVVTCQIYGKQRDEEKQQAYDIEYLLKRHPSLRVAYVDGPKKMKEGPPKYFSCLVRSSNDKIVEVYRVELPGDPILGEGKPENQNHAVIFSRGELIQCIDMNQDGYLEECLKMPNLLATVDRPEHAKSPLTIIGFREYVFTGAVSNLASFMQIQELSFVSLGQRMLAHNFVRQHYGHPDIFDKMFAMGTGGTAKASKGINLSEDIFAGFNSTL